MRKVEQHFFILLQGYLIHQKTIIYERILNENIRILFAFNAIMNAIVKLAIHLLSASYIIENIFLTIFNSEWK